MTENKTIEAIIALVIGFIILFSFEPTKILIENIVGTILSAVFIGVIIAIIIFVGWLIIRYYEENY